MGYGRGEQRDSPAQRRACMSQQGARVQSKQLKIWVHKARSREEQEVSGEAGMAPGHGEPCVPSLGSAVFI